MNGWIGLLISWTMAAILAHHGPVFWIIIVLTRARMTWPCSCVASFGWVLELHIKITLGAIRSTQFITSPTTHLNGAFPSTV